MSDEGASSDRTRLSQDGELEFAAMQRMLQLSEGTSSLSVAVCPGVAERDYWIERLKRKITESREVEIDSYEVDLLEAVRTKLGTTTPRALLITGLERFLHTRSSGLSILIESLNRSREKWQAFRCPVLFWVDPSGLKTITSASRDLWAWIAHEFEFPARLLTTESYARDDVLDAVQQDNLPWSAKGFRIEELTRRLEQIGLPPAAAGDHSAFAAWWVERSNHAIDLRDLETAAAWSETLLDALPDKEQWFGLCASTYHQLGMIAEKRRDFEDAEKWYLKSLAINEKQGNAHGAAITYHQLGMIAEERRDFEDAEKWYLKSLEIKEKQGNAHGAAITYHQLGRIAQECEQYLHSAQLRVRAIRTFKKNNDDYRANVALGVLSDFMKQVPKEDLEAIKRTFDDELQKELERRDSGDVN